MDLCENKSLGQKSHNVMHKVTSKDGLFLVCLNSNVNNFVIFST